MQRDSDTAPGLEGMLTPQQKQAAAAAAEMQAAAQFKLSPEEALVLRECNKESFFQRCIPLSALLGFGTYYAVNAGYLKPNNRWGAIPKIAVAVTVGYFAGKFSYQSKCAEKLMALPNSRLGDILRQRQRGGIRESIDPSFGATMSLAPFSNVPALDTYSDLGPRTSDMDTYRPMESFDDSHFSLEGLRDDKLPTKPEEFTSYEELRKQNRDEFQKNRGANYKIFPEPTSPSSGSDPRDDTYNPPPTTNLYGDSWSR